MSTNTEGEKKGEDQKSSLSTKCKIVICQAGEFCWDNQDVAHKLFPRIKEWAGPMRRFFNLKKIGSQFTVVANEGDNLASARELIAKTSNKASSKKYMSNTSKACQACLESSSDDVKGIQRAIIADQTKVLDKLLWQEIVCNGFFVAMQVASLTLICNEVANAKNVLSESKNDATKILENVDKLKEMNDDLREKILLFILFAGMEFSTEQNDDDNHQWKEKIDKTKQEYAQVKKDKFVFLQILNDFSLELQNCSGLCTSTLVLLSNIKLKVNNQVMMLKFVRNSLIKDQVVNAGQAVSFLLEVLLTKDFISKGVLITKSVFGAIFAGLTIAGTTTCVITVHRMNKLRESIASLELLGSRFREIDENIVELRKIVQELNKLSGDDQNKDEILKLLDYFVSPLTEEEEQMLLKQSASEKNISK